MGLVKALRKNLLFSGVYFVDRAIYKVENKKLSVMMKIPHIGIVYGVSWNKFDE